MGLLSNVFQKCFNRFTAFYGNISRQILKYYLRKHVKTISCTTMMSLPIKFPKMPVTNIIM